MGTKPARPLPTPDQTRQSDSPLGWWKNSTRGATATVTSDAHFSRDVLLTNIMLYWVTGAIGSSFGLTTRGCTGPRSFHPVKGQRPDRLCRVPARGFSRRRAACCNTYAGSHAGLAADFRRTLPQLLEGPRSSWLRRSALFFARCGQPTMAYKFQSRLRVHQQSSLIRNTWIRNTCRVLDRTEDNARGYKSLPSVGT